MYVTHIICNKCGSSYSHEEIQTVCTRCGSTLLVQYDFESLKELFSSIDSREENAHCGDIMKYFLWKKRTLSL
jgi:threonine synthase